MEIAPADLIAPQPIRISMRFTTLILVPIVATASGCGGGSATPAITTTETIAAVSPPPLPADTDIIAKIYDP